MVDDLLGIRFDCMAAAGIDMDMDMMCHHRNNQLDSRNMTLKLKLENKIWFFISLFLVPSFISVLRLFYSYKVSHGRRARVHTLKRHTRALALNNYANSFLIRFIHRVTESPFH